MNKNLHETDELTFEIGELYRELETMDSDMREVITSRLKGYTVEEIACQMNTTPTVVQAILNAAKQHLHHAR